MVTSWMASVLQVLGMVAAVVGLAMFAPAAGVIGGGVALVVLGLAVDPARGDE